ncbi:orotidine-5'-phosphate decarboxylase [Amphibiibacter pelophylacis]|uniref:Orotidine-5'-phosphate decarboxylase n=1 Tax=Amphibiibacter pelophylacis TaxID=1799477 RepID=A0ACC6NZE8_9BURK
MARPDFRHQLEQAQRQNRSLLCVGLDPEPSRLPEALRDQPDALFAFCAAIVDATADRVCAFKPQIAYFAAHSGGEAQLERLLAHIRAVAPQVPVILDAKRGDIGSTAAQYAREAFERYGADALTLSPYMGSDSISPYWDYPQRGLFLLCRTSNPGGDDLQQLPLQDAAGPPGERLYERVARLAASQWDPHGQTGLVVGATYPQELARVRELAPGLPLLVPGVGAQGGDAAAVVRAGWAGPGTLVVNASRAVIYAGSGTDFAQAARAAAQALRDELNAALAAPL